MPPTPRSPAARARFRDHGLRRVSLVTRGLVAVSVVGAGAFAALAAATHPGRSKTAQAGTSLRGRSLGFNVPASNSLTDPMVTTTTQPDVSAGNGVDNLAPPP